MHHNKMELYVHLVWATWDREPLLVPIIQRDLYRDIQFEARQLGCKVLAVNGREEHTHFVGKFSATLAIATLVKQIKGTSSHLLNAIMKPNPPFRWQAGYGAFTISRWDVDEVVQYVLNQQRHHAECSIIDEYEEIFLNDPF
jgi:REP element-mobilizing transposase RayT